MKIEISKSIRFRGVNALAAKTGYSKTHISRVLHGQIIPKEELAKKLKKLGVEVPAAE